MWFDLFVFLVKMWNPIKYPKRFGILWFPKAQFKIFSGNSSKSSTVVSNKMPIFAIYMKEKGRSSHVLEHTYELEPIISLMVIDNCICTNLSSTKTRYMRPAFVPNGDALPLHSSILKFLTMSSLQKKSKKLGKST